MVWLELHVGEIPASAIRYAAFLRLVLPMG